MYLYGLTYTHMILCEHVYILTHVTRGWCIVTDHEGFTLNHDSKAFSNVNSIDCMASTIQENLRPVVA